MDLLMSDGEIDLTNVKDYKSETYTVEICRLATTGVAVTETWKNTKGKLHRPLRDGPALFYRDPNTGAIEADRSKYCLNGEWVDPKTGKPMLPSRPHRKQKTRPLKPR
jgi:hypothetical protein